VISAEFWIGFATGVWFLGSTIVVIATVYVKTRGPFIVGPSQPPERKK